MADSHVIRGRVAGSQQRIPAGSVVRAYDRDLREEEFVGEAEADADGRFEISYTAEQFRRAEKRTADLVLRVVDANGRPLAIRRLEVNGVERDEPGTPIFNAPERIDVMLTVEDQRPEDGSEYERLVADITPVLGSLSLAELTKDDLTFIQGDLELDGQDTENVGMLRAAAGLAARSQAPAEAFYAWGRLGIPERWSQLPRVTDQQLPPLLDRLLDELVALPDDRLISGLRTAADRHLVPERIGAAAATMVRLLRRHLQTRRDVAIRLTDKGSGEPLAGYVVKTIDLDDGGIELGTDITDASGAFRFSIYLPREHADQRRLQFAVSGAEAGQTADITTAIRLASDEIPVLRTSIPWRTARTLTELRAAAQLDVPQDLLVRLASHEMRTLADIRRAGGAARLRRMDGADPSHVTTLAALADLDRVSADVTLTSAVLDAGFPSVFAIANTPLDEFRSRVAAVRPTAAPVLENLHINARAQHAFLDTVLTGAATDPGGFAPLMTPLSAGGPGAPPPGSDPADAVAQLFGRSCSCPDCEAATSPAAYLADLLDYAIKHVRNDSDPIDLPFLVDTMGQPFDALPMDCGAVEEPVRQVRICIEVMRDYLGTRPLLEAPRERRLADAESAYRLTAYRALLAQLGTTYEELRRARTAAPTERGVLAETLGIDLGPRNADPAHPGDELDHLTLDPTLPPHLPGALSEAALERLFGLQSTTRDPLSSGDKRGDNGEQISRWHLEGVRWSVNTSLDGRIYLSLLKTSPTTFDVFAYADEARTRGMGAAERATPDGPLAMKPENGSGLSGRFEIAYTDDDTDIELQVVPQMLVWRLRHLRTLWSLADSPADGSAGPLGAVPIIDPDVIGPADFAHLTAGNAAFDIWQVRHDWLVARRAALQSTRESQPTPLAGINEILVVALSAAAGHPVAIGDLDALQTDEKAGHNIDDRVQGYGLTYGAFSYLMRLRALAAAAQPIPAGEWDTAYDTLVTAQKIRTYDTWRAFERTQHITLGPDLFRIADERDAPARASDVGLPLWLSTLEARDAWTTLLMARIDQQASTRSAYDEALGAAEETVLPQLRDALIDATDAEGGTLAERADWLTTRLSIDARMDGCHITTRVEQAIETLQTLLFGLRTGQVVPDTLRYLAPIAGVRVAATPDPTAARLDVFARLDDGMLYHRVFEAGRWRRWHSLGALPGTPGSVSTPSDLAVVSHGPGLLDLAVRGTDRAFWHRTLDERGWSAWRRLDGELEGNPAAVPLGANRMEAFALRAGDDILQEREYDGRWLNWEASTVVASRSPAACSWGPGRLDVALAINAPAPFTPLHRWWDGAWHEETLDSQLASDPALVSWGSGRLDLFQQRGGALWHKSWEPAGWNAWENLDIAEPGGPSLKGAPAACSGGTGRISVFCVRNDEVCQKRYDDPTWSSWQPLPALDLTLQAEHFDAEWRWLGSYATWRAAVFVYIHPYNLLQPSLRAYQTPVFADIVHETQLATVDSSKACELAKRYGDYFRDVCSLEIEASCQAFTVQAPGPCQPGPFKQRQHVFLFGRAKSGRVYWSAVDSQDTSGYAQSFWQEVPDVVVDGGAGTPGTRVDRIIGAIPSESDDRGGRFIYLVLNVRAFDGRKLMTVRFNLDAYGTSAAWSKPTEVKELPRPLFSLAVLPVQNDALTEPPRLAIHDDRYTLDVYVRTLNATGDGWLRAGEPWGNFEVTPRYLDAVGVAPESVKVLEAALQVAGVTWIVYRHGTMRRAYPAGKLAVVIDQEGQPFRGARPCWRPYPSTDTAIFVFYDSDDQRVYRRVTAAGAGPERITLGDLSRIVPHAGITGVQMLAYVSTIDQGVAWAYHVREAGDELVGSKKFRIVPRASTYPEVRCGLTDAELLSRPAAVKSDFVLNADAPLSVLTYFQEAHYFVRLQLALKLQAAGDYTAALDWYRTIYNYAATPERRNVYYGLTLETALKPLAVLEQAENWLLDPLNPHQLALTRRYAYTRFTLMSLAKCLLEYADAEFTIDNPESVARARTLYLTALAQLDAPAFDDGGDACALPLAELTITPGETIPASAPAELAEIVDELTKGGVPSHSPYWNQLTAVLQAGQKWSAKLSAMKGVVEQAMKTTAPPMTSGGAVSAKNAAQPYIHQWLLTQPGVDAATMAAGDFAVDVGTMHTMSGGGGGAGVGIPAAAPAVPTPPVSLPAYGFCLPPNPVVVSLRRHAELNLAKLRSCRNIAGLHRRLDAYAAPTGATTGLPVFSASGQIAIPGAAQARPTIYRYPVLLDRAKQLVHLAAQVEASMLAAREKRDESEYTLLRARQDLDVAQANVRLQSVRLVESQDGVRLATLQRDRAQIQAHTYRSWIDAGYLESEQNYLAEIYNLSYLRRQLASAEMNSRVASVGMDPIADVFGLAHTGDYVSIARLAGRIAKSEAAMQVDQFLSNYERRRQEWELQLGVAEQDVAIGAEQITLADDRVEIVKQEGVIANLQASNANRVVDFLERKRFTSLDLYDWMSGVLESSYRFFLQHATATARMAETQLAFERQELPTTFIAADYWTPPSSDGMNGGPGTTKIDRKGLTGAERLLQDLTSLDQYAFNTNRRKLQITKTISLARTAPAAFQQMLETGVLAFATPMSLFDRDFPGHYLRLIRRVRTSVIALVPPVDGIHATLSNSGISRAVVGPDVFQPLTIRREPETVALSSPINATGLFELDAQASDMYNPFEGLGVDGTWEFRLPKPANAIEYPTIADVLLSIDYTAFDSREYAQQVTRQLTSRVQGDRLFSLKETFADAWYDLHNPELLAPEQRMIVAFNTAARDFPPNLRDPRIDQLLLYFVRADGMTEEMPIASLKFKPAAGAPAGGGPVTSIDGAVSTRRGNAGAWQSILGLPATGTWELNLQTGDANRDKTIQRWFKDEKFEDVVLVVSYTGRVPPWPA